MCIDRDGVCKSCAREYDDLPEYSACPSDDCPSNNEELEESKQGQNSMLIYYCVQKGAPLIEIDRSIIK